MEKEYDACAICPRACGTNRNAGDTGYCGEDSRLRVSWTGLHFGEEPPVAGAGGSGTVFVTGCNLRCRFCQNWQISRDGLGRAVEAAEFADICLALQDAGAENINIVTGSHAIPALATALSLARKRGLTIPILWNTSSYENIEALERLEGLVTVWLPDLKTLNPVLAEAVFQAADYPKAAKKAIRWMAEKSPLVIERPDDDRYPSGRIVSGVIVRHLALPGKIADTELVLRWFAEHLRDKAILSLMTQYTPVKESPYAAGMDAFPDRALERGEYKKLTAMLEDLGIDDGFYQELVEDTEWLPDFRKKQPFSSKLAKPIWHYEYGFIKNHES